MSFRTRLTSFFVVIVVVPMLAIGFLVFRLIDDSARGKADARVDGLATAAASVYAAERASATVAAQTIARSPGLLSGPGLRARVESLALQSGLARVRIAARRRVLADVGDPNAIAPGVAVIRGAGGAPPGTGAPRSITVTVSTLTAVGYARKLAARGVGVVVTQSGRVLASTLRLKPGTRVPRRGTLTVGTTQYRTMTQSFPGFSSKRVGVALLSSLSSTSTGSGTDRLVAAVFILGFLFLAVSFSILASRALQGQLGRFLQAARRLAGGDFSSPVPIEGHDEFAELGVEFNAMSGQLASRLEELSHARDRLRGSIRRIGETFAANLDRPALLELALKAAVDAVQAQFGRLSVRSRSDEPLAETVRIGSLQDAAEQLYEAEKAALGSGGFGEVSKDGTNIASVALGPLEPQGRAHGLITVGREGREFDDDDRDLLRSLASRATLALENVELHHQMSRQAVTDELTGLANHGRFQELLSSEMDQVRRYRYPVGLILLDVDDFKAVNDTYGHQQGDLVLRQVARVLSETSRETDTAARYGGDELALILPHTGLEGSHAIAERLRSAIERLRIPRLDGDGSLRVTASLGVSASSEGDKYALIADADGALYAAKRQGKNRAVNAREATANVLGGE